ncbi:glutamate decarboxylase isozyme, partial [Salmonella enterica subsp. enterica serovar Bareilly]|nr:glutamate decarboxylase isozyme [Salmonella enterica subsp. enterica serovar Bareilly]
LSSIAASTRAMTSSRCDILSP